MKPTNEIQLPTGCRVESPKVPGSYWFVRCSCGWGEPQESELEAKLRLMFHRASMTALRCPDRFEPSFRLEESADEGRSWFTIKLFSTLSEANDSMRRRFEFEVGPKDWAVDLRLVKHTETEVVVDGMRRPARPTSEEAPPA